MPSSRRLSTARCRARGRNASRTEYRYGTVEIEGPSTTLVQTIKDLCTTVPGGTIHMNATTTSQPFQCRQPWQPMHGNGHIDLSLRLDPTVEYADHPPESSGRHRSPRNFVHRRDCPSRVTVEGAGHWWSA